MRGVFADEVVKILSTPLSFRARPNDLSSKSALQIAQLENCNVFWVGSSIDGFFASWENSALGLFN
jgi:hypothetical protein